VSSSLDLHYHQVARAFLDGRVVPLLGAGVNLCNRPAGTPWRQGQYLPNGAELAAHLARYFNYPSAPDATQSPSVDLVRVSQFISVMTGEGPLYEALHGIFDADYPPTTLHHLLARLPALLRPGPRTGWPLILTTNYDDALERAFKESGEDFDLVVYVADGQGAGKFVHKPPNGRPRPIVRPNKYVAVSCDLRPVILKIHGAVDRESPDSDSYVITEDHYIDYLTRTEISNLIPVKLAAMLRRSHFLFLGYGMRDWNLRVILHRIWGQQRLSYRSWAIQAGPDEMEQKVWHERGVDILDVPLGEYVQGLERCLVAASEDRASELA
jgi:hypothetical protein